VQNVKNFGGALVFIAYFIFLDHPRAEAITAKRMKIDLYCQQQNCSPLNVLFSDV